MTADVNELSGAIAKILVILSLFILVFTLLTCFANVVLFGKIFGKESKKKWLSFVPFVNDYIIYDTFWNTKNVCVIHRSQFCHAGCDKICK